MQIDHSCLFTFFTYGFKKKLYAILSALLLAGMLTPAGAAANWVETLAAGCDSGATVQCLSLGTAYLRGELDGRKLKIDKAKASHWIKKGIRVGEQNCRNNAAADCYALGLAYFEGRVTQTDIPRGLEFMQKACDQHYEKACVWLRDSGITFTIK